MLIIGFGHKARQGKNSAARAILDACPVETFVIRYAYADALRKEVAQAIREAGGLDALIRRGFVEDICRTPRIANFPGWVKAEAGKPRTLLQWWGTNYRREQDADYWIKRLMERIAKDAPDLALITDVRFTNEAEAIHAAGGYLVKVTRTTAPDVIVPAHPSENELDGYAGWDFEIKAASVAQLSKQAVVIYRKIAGKQ